MNETRTTTRAPASRQRRFQLALALGVLLATSMLALAQADAPSDDAPAEAPAAEAAARWLRNRAPHAWPGMQPGMRGPARGGPALREHLAERLEGRLPRVAGPWVDPALRAGVARHGAAAFRHWLAATPAALPVAPGLVGPVPDGTEVRVSVYDDNPDDGGNLLASLVYRAGSDDLAAFHRDLREAAAEATHLVIDVLGRSVALSTQSTGTSD